MNPKINFKNIWQQQKVAPPDVENLHSQIKKFKKAGYKQLVIVNILLLMTVAIIICMWHFFDPEFITTKIGMALVIVGMLIFIMVYNASFKYYKTSTVAKTNADYLRDFILLKRKQKFLQTRLLELYFILLSMGIGLYLYEYVSLMPIFWGVATYALTLSWLAFNWWYLRPKIIKKNEQKLDVYIDTLERIQRQIN